MEILANVSEIAEFIKLLILIGLNGTEGGHLIFVKILR